MIRSILLAAAAASAPSPASPPPAGAANYIATTLHLSRYKSASVDLNGDSVGEVLVYAEEPQECGSGGCTLYVITPSAGSYRVVTKLSISHLPIRILATSAHGWRDLGVQVAGGGITRAYEARLTFDGKTYPENPTVAPAKPLAKAEGRVVLE